MVGYPNGGLSEWWAMLAVDGWISPEETRGSVDSPRIERRGLKRSPIIAAHSAPVPGRVPEHGPCSGHCRRSNLRFGRTRQRRQLDIAARDLRKTLVDPFRHLLLLRQGLLQQRHEGLELPVLGHGDER